MQTVHSIPADGTIEIEFPKWNSFATNAAQLESFVATSTSPGTVACSAISNIPMADGTSMNCQLTHGTTSDTLRVFFDGLLLSAVPPNTALSFSVNGVRGPPTTSIVTGFNFKTTSKLGEMIDETAAGTQIELKVNAAAVSQSSNVEVSSNDPSINEPSTLTVRISLVNPIQTDSNVQITIPSDFGVNLVTNVYTLGSSLHPTPAWTFDPSTRLLTVTAVNRQYLASR